ncbi:hypothetical protein MTO96_042407, partial [Rhipicephalus appendiculatus]
MPREDLMDEVTDWYFTGWDEVEEAVDKAELARKNPQCDKSVGGRRVSSLEEGVKKSEAPLKELGRSDSSDPETGSRRQGHGCGVAQLPPPHGSSAERGPSPHRRPPTQPAHGSEIAAASKGTKYKMNR